MHEPSSATFFLCQFVLHTNSIWSEVRLEGKLFVEILRITREFGSPKYESCLCPFFHMLDYRCTTFILWCTAAESTISFDAVGMTESSSWAYHSLIFYVESSILSGDCVFNDTNLSTADDMALLQYLRDIFCDSHLGCFHHPHMVPYLITDSSVFGWYFGPSNWSVYTMDYTHSRIIFSFRQYLKLGCLSLHINW